jgi:hypothetical protein
MERLVKRMKLHRVSGTVVHHCALMVKYLEREGIEAYMVKGWCIYGQEACTHYWVTDKDGAVYDIGYQLGCLYNPELMAYTPRLCVDKPEGIAFADEAEVALKAEHERQYELFQEQRNTFWKESPDDVRNFKLV